MTAFLVSLYVFAGSHDLTRNIITWAINDGLNVGAIVKLNGARTHLGYSRDLGFRILMEDRHRRVIMKYGGWVEM